MFKFLWKLIKGILALVLLLVIITIAYTFLKPEEKETYREVKWPDSELAAIIPEVGENGAFIGEVNYDSSTSLSVTIANTEGSDFDSYVSACKDKGFTVDYSSSSDSYRANNQEGYSVYISYDEKDKTMDVSVNTPEKKKAHKKKKASKQQETADGSSTDDTAPVTEPTEATPTEKVTEKVTEAPAEATVADDQIRPEFKEAMDSYESFFDEYVEFMKKYSESGSPVTMALDYANYLSKYTEMMEKLDELGEEEMTTAELGYYTEVMGRITQKLATVATE